MLKKRRRKKTVIIYRQQNTELYHWNLFLEGKKKYNYKEELKTETQEKNLLLVSEANNYVIFYLYNTFQDTDYKVLHTKMIKKQNSCPKINK